MEILPILSSLRRNKVGAALIGAQIALTLAIVCNCLSIIQAYRGQMARPSGIDEANIFTANSNWVREPDELKADIVADLAALRSLPGVIDADATSGFPLSGLGAGTGISRKAGQSQADTYTAEYFVDEHGLAAFGVNLIAGRWFTADEISDLRKGEDDAAASIVITQRLGRVLFPSGDALGRLVYLQSGTTPKRIVGIVERTQSPSAAYSWAQSSAENSAFLPHRYLFNHMTYYVIRVRPGALATAMAAVPDRLYALSRRRLISNMAPFWETRQQTYQSQHSLSVLLGVLCAVLLAVTACGIVGLVLYWVAQRRRQIGMRRALGARRMDILRYFHLENLLIAGAGAIFGIAIGVAGNTWLAATLELTRMSAGYICIGALIVLSLSQLAVIWPALRAASIPPAIAARGL
jgi:putative ABC transport system permease protein